MFAPYGCNLSLALRYNLNFTATLFPLQNNILSRNNFSILTLLDVTLPVQVLYYSVNTGLFISHLFPELLIDSYLARVE